MTRENARFEQIAVFNGTKTLKIVSKINKKAIDMAGFVWYNVVTSANGSFCCA